MTAPLTSYKYRSGAVALRCLAQGVMYFASPQELNDSVEATFDFASAKQFSDVFHSAMNELAVHRGFPTGLSCVKRTPKEFRSVNQRENRRFLEGCKKIGVFSTAQRPDNQPMWAYYCNNSQGVCFELEWSEEVLAKCGLWPTKVTYTREPRIHNRAEDFRNLLLELGRENPTWSMAQIEAYSLTDQFRRRWGISSTARAVSTKHADWEHEREIRIVSPRAGLIPMLHDVLRSVFFVRHDFEEWGSIVTILHQNYPKVRLMGLKFHHKTPFVTSHELNFKKIPV